MIIMQLAKSCNIILKFVNIKRYLNVLGQCFTFLTYCYWHNRWLGTRAVISYSQRNGSKILFHSLRKKSYNVKLTINTSDMLLQGEFFLSNLVDSLLYSARTEEAVDRHRPSLPHPVASGIILKALSNVGNGKIS